MALMTRTDSEIWEQTQELARKFYSLMGCEVPKGFRFDLSRHPQEKMCWCMASIAQQELTSTDPQDCRPDGP
jgi:hypothetical protein